MIEGISTRRVESTPANDPTRGVASRQQQEQRGERQSGAAGDTLSLSTEAQQQLSKLQQRDSEVRAHEQAHISAGGPHVTGGASYSYSRGVDGRQYAVGGSVSIDTSSIPGNPEATEEKARMVRSAALAPAAPSAQDQNVAAQAATTEQQAQSEKRTRKEDGPASGSRPGNTLGVGKGAEGSSDKNEGQGEAGTAAQWSFQRVAGDTTAADRTPPHVASVDAPRGAQKLDAESARTADTPVTPLSSASTNGRATGFLFNAMEAQVRGDKVAALYQAQQDKFIPPTALAPNGTGIAHTV